MNSKKAKIIVIRHAEVDINRHIPIYSKEMREWVERYNHTKIKTNTPSTQTCNTINHSDKLFCSTLRRSSDSLALLGKTADEKDEIFNEVGVPYANWQGIKLYPDIWLVLFRIAWFFGYSSNSESFKESRIRAKKATQKLLKASSDNATVTLLGHGIMNKLIARELVTMGWKKRGRFGIKNWSYGVFELDVLT